MRCPQRLSAKTGEGADAGEIGTTESVANLLTAMTRGMAVGTDVVPDEILRDGPGETIGGTTTGAVTVGAITRPGIPVGGHAITDGETTTGAINGATTGGVIDATVARD